MARVPRTALPDGIFHVTARGVARATIFRSDADYREFRASLLRVADRFDWSLHAYCLMPNHYHLIIETSQAGLSDGMQRLNGRYAQSFNERYGHSGHVFQSRFAARVIASEEHYEHALAYVRANPVEARLCERIADWPWADGRYEPD